jgi:hypothetical protein
LCRPFGTLIDCFELPAWREEEFFAGYQKVYAYMRAKKGYVSNKMHRSLAPDARYRFVNVVEWESREAAHDAGFRELISRPGLAGVLSTPARMRLCMKRWLRRLVELKLACRELISQPGLASVLSTPARMRLCMKRWLKGCRAEARLPAFALLPSAYALGYSNAAATRLEMGRIESCSSLWALLASAYPLGYSSAAATRLEMGCYSW